MRIARSRGARLGALAVVASVALSACGGGGSIDEQTQANEEQAAESGGECGDLNMAVNPWVGFQASKDLKEDVSWQGFGTGEVDVVIEDWGHPDLEKKFFADQGDGSAEDFGPQGNVGIIGWFVPPWLAEEHPDILEWSNLNKYAKEFATSESGGQGQFIGADPSSSRGARPPPSRRSARPRRTRSGSSATGTSRSTSTPRSPCRGSRCRPTRRAARTTRRRSPATTPRPS
jgi:glycine betaine/proline transport system substrate-binding protein